MDAVELKVYLGPDDYHNRAVRAAIDDENVNDIARALNEVREGLQSYPNNVDLLADAVQWAPIGQPGQWGKTSDGADEGDSGIRLRCAEDFYQQLRKIEPFWNWRAYTFSINYFVDRKTSVYVSRDAREKILDEAIELADRFIAKDLDPDRAYSAKAKALIAKGHVKEAERLLDDVVIGDMAGCVPVSACCLRYVDLLIEAGRYQKAVRVAEKGILYNAQSQPSASLSYFVFCEALARDALLLQLADTAAETEKTPEDVAAEAKEVIELYELAAELTPESRSYSITIQQRKAFLMNRFGFPAFENARKMVAEYYGVPSMFLNYIPQIYHDLTKYSTDPRSSQDKVDNAHPESSTPINLQDFLD